MNLREKMRLYYYPETFYAVDIAMIDWEGEQRWQVTLEESIYVQEQHKYHAYEDSSGIDFRQM